MSEQGFDKAAADSLLSSDEVAARLRILRGLRQLSQATVARECEIHRESLSLIERGRQQITVRTLTRLARVYRVPVHVLLDPGSAWMEY